jgi:hypothetical protein
MPVRPPGEYPQPRPGNGILDAGADVLHGQRRIVVPNDLLEAEPFIQKFQDAVHGDARACNARLPEMYPGIDNDPVHSFAHLADDAVKLLNSTLITHIIPRDLPVPARCAGRTGWSRGTPASHRR